MQIEEYARQVQDQLGATAALGDDRARHIAGALATAAAPAVRLAIMSALAAAAEEITVALLDTPGSPAVAIRLDGDEVEVDIRGSEPGPLLAPRGEDGEASARISLRLSDGLKSEIDAAAARDGVSVNTWIIRAATRALYPAGGPGWDRRGGAHRVTGWING